MTVISSGFSPAYPVPRLYRYIEERDHAVQFLRGQIWVSTLDHVRNCDAARADRSDSDQNYTVTVINDQTPAEYRSAIDQNLAHFELAWSRGNVDRISKIDVKITLEQLRSVLAYLAVAVGRELYPGGEPSQKGSRETRVYFPYKGQRSSTGHSMGCCQNSV